MTSLSASTDVTLDTSSYDYLSISGQEITLGQIDYNADITNLPTLGTASASAATDFVAVLRLQRGHLLVFFYWLRP